MGIDGLLDTGAENTILPGPVAVQLGLVVVGRVMANAFGGHRSYLDVVRVVVELPGVAPVLLDTPVHPNEKFVLVGRDFLNQFRVTFDGPNQVAEFH